MRPMPGECWKNSASSIPESAVPNWNIHSIDILWSWTERNRLRKEALWREKYRLEREARHPSAKWQKSREEGYVKEFPWAPQHQTRERKVVLGPDTCWRCGMVGHHRNRCSFAPLLFCSGCGKVCRMSRDCCGKQGIGSGEVCIPKI